MSSARWRRAGDRILGLVGITGTGIHPRIGAIDAQLGELPHGGLDRRPQLLLIGVELQPGMDGGDPRVDEGGAVLGVHAHVADVLHPRAMILGIDRARAGDAEHGDGCDGEFPHTNLLLKDAPRMSAARLTRNLQLGQGARCYEDVTADFTSSRDRKSFATRRLPCGPHGSLRSSFIVR
ncbi:hypothetical protein ABIA43_000575 [Bradyrhizobium sp. USDA 328]